MRRLVRAIYPVERGEAFAFWTVVAANFLLVFGILLGRNVRDSLFLKNFGVGNLPYMYAIAPLLVVACSYAYSHFSERVDRMRWLAATCLFYVGLIAISRAVLFTGVQWAYPTMYMLVQALWALTVMQFWSFAGDIFDLRQAKRLYPFITVGGLLGMVGAGLFIGPAVRLLGTANVLLLWIPCLAAAIWLLRTALRTAGTAASATAEPKPARSLLAQAGESLTVVGRTPLLRAMAGIAVTMPLVLVLVDFQFSAAMTEAYPTEDKLTAFLGVFRGWIGLGCLLVQVTITPFVISRWGVGTAVLAHPSIMMVGAAALLLHFSYGSAVFAKFMDNLLLFSFQDSAIQLLYNPLPVEARNRARNFIEGYLKPLTGTIAGLMLIAAHRWHFPPWHISAVAVALAAVWTFSSYRVGASYLKALLANLAGPDASRRTTAARALSQLKDRESLQRLFDAISSAAPGQALVAIHFLERFGQPEAQERLGTLAQHENALVRATAVAALGRLKHPSLAGLMPHLLTDSDARVRANAIEALGSDDAATWREQLLPLMHDASPRVCANAIRLLARVPELTGEAFDACLKMCASSDPAIREAGAFALAVFPPGLASEPLLRLLGDAAGSPWKQPLRSLAEVGDDSTVEAVLRASRVCPAAKHEALRAVAAIHARYGPAVMRRLLELVRMPDKVGLRMEVLMALGRLGDPVALPAFTESVLSHDVFLRNRALAGIERLSEHHAVPDDVLDAVRKSAREDIAMLETTLAYARALAQMPEPTVHVLQQSMQQEAKYIHTRIFRAVGILSDRHQARLIAKQLPVPVNGAASSQPGAERFGSGRISREQASALEALEYLAGADLGAPLARVLEGCVETIPPLPEVFGILSSHPVAWVRACTAYVIGRAGLAEHAGLLRSVRHSGQPMVRQAAIYSISRFASQFEDGSAASAIAQGALDDPHPAVRALAEAVLQGRTMLLLVEKVLFLKSVPLFAALEGDELARVAEISAEQEFAGGAIVFRENDEAQNLFVIVSGRVKVFRGAAPREKRLAELGERECFGEMALLDDEPRSASVVTLEPCRFLTIRRDDFRELLIDRPQISLEIMRLLSRRLRNMDIEAEGQPEIPAARVGV